MLPTLNGIVCLAYYYRRIENSDPGSHEMGDTGPLQILDRIPLLYFTRLCASRDKLLGMEPELYVTLYRLLTAS